MKSFEVNTHHAYLNTDIILKSIGEACEVHDQTTGAIYNVDSILTIKLCAGKHMLYCAETDQSEEIVIEDAIKLGGSNIKYNASFVSEITPWVAVTMKDRIYFYNRDTKAEFVEHNLSPKSVKYIGGKANEYFLFGSENDYSVFNAINRQVTYNCNSVIYTNDHLVISEEDNVLTVYDYISDVFILQYEGQYSIYESSLFYVCDDCINKLDLDNNETSQLKCKISTNDFLFSERYVLVLHDNYGTKLRYHLIDLKLDINHTIDMDYCIASVCGSTFSASQDMESSFNEVITKYSDLLFSNQMSLSMSVYNIMQFGMVDGKEVVDIELVTKEYKNKRSVKSYRYLRFNRSGYIDYRDATEIDKPMSEVTEPQPPFKIDSDKGSLICYSENRNIYISRKDNKLFETNIQDNSCNEILRTIFDSSRYLNAFFNSDGSSVVAIKNYHTACLLGFEDLLEAEFDTTNLTVPFLRGYGVNGYQPVLSIFSNDFRKPVWRDPITLNIINEEDRFNRIFKSPDGNYIAYMNEKKVIQNNITGAEITSEEHTELKKKFNWNSEVVSTTEKQQKIELRKQFFEKHEEYFSKKSRDIDADLKFDCFTQLFIDILYYVVYKRTDKEGANKVLIGKDVWFLNYVSFSYDSRYLAFGVKLYDGRGIYKIYDIIEQKFVVENSITSSRSAVWLAMFSRRGDAAFYTSYPNTYIVKEFSNDTETVINNRSFLSFSPSGKYMALSNQGYIPYNNGKNKNWGHQPSGNIYIHYVDNPTEVLEHCNDWGEDIAGLSSRKGSVASAAFSTDEKRFLAVGNDGVVVVRNLKFAESPNTENVDTDDLPF